MILSDVLGSLVLDSDGTELGRTTDARFAVNEGVTGIGQAKLVGFIVSPHARGSWLGYERSGFDRPVLIASLLRWWHRGSFLVKWDDVAGIYQDHLELRPGFERLDAGLPD